MEDLNESGTNQSLIRLGDVVLCLALLLLIVSNLYLYAQLFLSIIIIFNVFTAYIFFLFLP